MTPALDVSVDFSRLRSPVWERFHARHPLYTHDRFEDAYAEWWTREVERGVAGKPSRPVAPVPFVADAVHRVLIDEGRALARGLSRGDEKQALTFVGLDEVERGRSGADREDGPYRLLVHRILDLVHARLTQRERGVFVASYLYLQPVSVVAQALGLSVPRVKKDRARIARKVGEEVWEVLQGELDLCEAYSERRLPAVLELLTVHVDGCPRCRAQLGGVRSSAHALVGPVEVAALVSAGGGLSGFADAVWSRVSGATEAASARVGDVSARAGDAVSAQAGGRFAGAGHRLAELVASVPPSGRTVAIVGLVGAAVAGGGAAVEQRTPQQEVRARPTAAPPRATPSPVARPNIAPPAAAPAGAAAPGTAPPDVRAKTSRRAVARRRAARRRAARRRAEAARRRAAAQPAPTPAPTVQPVAPPPGGGTEFGFETG